MSSAPGHSGFQLRGDAESVLLLPNCISHFLHKTDLLRDKLSRTLVSLLAEIQLEFGISQGANNHVCILVLFLLGVL